VPWPKMSRSLACFVLLFAVAFLASACRGGEGSAGTTTVHEGQEGSEGNTPGNAANGGLVVQGDGFVYYATADPRSPWHGTPRT
jgi:hypothetical protein